MNIRIPDLSLVVLIGPSGSGKSTFALEHFKPTEVLSSDYCRALVADNENDQSATAEAFEVLQFIAGKRLAKGRLTVIDATNVQEEARKPLVELARKYYCLPVAIVFDLPEALCLERNRARLDRQFGPHVVHQQCQQLRRSVSRLKREGFRHVQVLSSAEEIASTVIEREPLWNNRKSEHGPFDIIGDVHGCFRELVSLLTKLEYDVRVTASEETGPRFEVAHPAGRKVVFLGDLVDRGPEITNVLRLVMSMVESSVAICVPGNHDMKLVHKFKGRDVRITHGLAESLSQLEGEAAHFRRQAVDFLDGLVSHYVLDNGRLVVAHAGMREEMQGRGSGRVRDFALYGETTGEVDEFGLPVRSNWAAEYRGESTVVYGHTPVPEPEWLNRTINIDTGCVFGGKLTALRYPEMELVNVPAEQTYYEPVRPLLSSEEPVALLSAQQTQDDLLDVDDVMGKRIVNTRLRSSVTIREENATAALEVMTRFAANPKWLIYLPPTMSPSETSRETGLLEHPAEAFAYYRREGVQEVVCEQKHMGSRTVVVLCRDEDAARRRFGVVDDGFGICYTRTGRRFFEDRAMENQLLGRVRSALEAAGFWEEFKTDWVCLDCELMPWSVKAQELLREQYAAVGSAARSSLAAAITTLEDATDQHPDIAQLLEAYKERRDMVERYVAAYRHYCWPVHSVSDLRLAPFHLLATEGAVHVDKNHAWHMETLRGLCHSDQEVLLATPYRIVDVRDAASVDEGVHWWEELTRNGGEGMVVKPFDFVAPGPRGLMQPALKCRGREYLRIIYGPEYTVASNLERLRPRSLGAKRSLAIREFALGIEALERFVRKEPLRSVHECVFSVLALESEPVDPRL